MAEPLAFPVGAPVMIVSLARKVHYNGCMAHVHGPAAGQGTEARVAVIVDRDPTGEHNLSGRRLHVQPCNLVRATWLGVAAGVGATPEACPLKPYHHLMNDLPMRTCYPSRCPCCGFNQDEADARSDFSPATLASLVLARKAANRTVLQSHCPVHSGPPDWNDQALCDAIREPFLDTTAHDAFTRKGRSPEVVAALYAYSFDVKPDPMYELASAEACTTEEASTPGAGSPMGRVKAAVKASMTTIRAAAAKFTAAADYEENPRCVPYVCFEAYVRKVNGNMRLIRPICKLAKIIRRDPLFCRLDMCPSKAAVDCDLVHAVLHHEGVPSNDSCCSIVFSMCANALIRKSEVRHCRECGECQEWRYWHCKGCNLCQYGISYPCEACQPELHRHRSRDQGCLC